MFFLPLFCCARVIVRLVHHPCIKGITEKRWASDLVEWCCMKCLPAHALLLKPFPEKQCLLSIVYLYMHRCMEGGSGQQVSLSITLHIILWEMVSFLPPRLTVRQDWLTGESVSCCWVTELLTYPLFYMGADSMNSYPHCLCAKCFTNWGIFPEPPLLQSLMAQFMKVNFLNWTM